MPFTGLNTTIRFLEQEAKSILDVGCGKGVSMKFINRHKRFFAVGVDTFKPYIEQGKKEGIHEDYILGDVTHFLKFSDR